MTTAKSIQSFFGGTGKVSKIKGRLSIEDLRPTPSSSENWVRETKNLPLALNLLYQLFRIRGNT